jgi:hypothetical protein
MAVSKGSVLGIIALILAITGAGLGGYSLYTTLTVPSQQSEAHYHMARAYLNATYDISYEHWHTVNFTALSYNVGGNFDLDTDLFTCTYEGYYLISGMVTLEPLDTGYEMNIAIVRNSVTFEAGTIVQGSYLGPISAGVADVLYLYVGDVIELQVWHTYITPSTVYGNQDDRSTYLSIMLIEN